MISTTGQKLIQQNLEISPVAWNEFEAIFKRFNDQCDDSKLFFPKYDVINFDKIFVSNENDLCIKIIELCK